MEIGDWGLGAAARAQNISPLKVNTRSRGTTHRKEPSCAVRICIRHNATSLSHVSRCRRRRVNEPDSTHVVKPTRSRDDMPYSCSSSSTHTRQLRLLPPPPHKNIIHSLSLSPSQKGERYHVPSSKNPSISHQIPPPPSSVLLVDYME